MQVAQVKPGVDQQSLEDMARHMGMRVGYQGGFQILLTDSSKMDTGTPNNSRNATPLSSVSISDEHGFCEGDICNRDGCTGIIETHDVEGCSCHINPPCAACTSPRNYCPECDWQEADEPIEEPKYTVEPWTPSPPKPLDKTKIDWRTRPHTHFTIIKEGVYPEGTTMSEVREKVNGTFGGRFEKFCNGKFVFIAYTD